MKFKDEKVVILCGGLGTRMKEETEYRPKALVDIGGRPILWHLMRTYYKYGYRKFVLCLGYKGWMIKDYFLNYQCRQHDFTLRLRSGASMVWDHSDEPEDWEITFVDTGANTQTGGRLFRIRHHIKEDYFLANYVDGLSDINLDELVAYHKDKKKTATLSGFHARSRYGVVRVNGDGIVNYWQEKPLMNDLTPGGFFVFNRNIFDALDEDCILEMGPLDKLAKTGELALYRHDGFWYCMDTFKEAQALNEMWACGKAPWRTWE
ncbi:MAG TPA: sugar phosphate nucleotidyltransferase [Candidatus Acidoferrales bacterium]|nr:sugar phosphate nucleotidyltransferase [Candidatus Acidoferrales bacterium]